MVSSQLIELEPLRTILNLERKNGYTNVAVIGGLDKFITIWSKQTKSRINSPALLASFNRMNLSEQEYAAMDRAGRELLIDSLLYWLTEAESIFQKHNSRKGTAPRKTYKNKSDTSVITKAVSANYEGKGLDDPVTVVKGIKSNIAVKLNKLGVRTVRDLLYFFPRRHLDYSQIKHISELEIGEEQTIVGTVWESREAKLGRLKGTELTLGDETGNIRAVWFNQPYLAKRFQTNAQVILSGKVTEFKGRGVLESPEWEIIDASELVHTGRLVPIYPLTRGLYQRQLRKLVKDAVDTWSGKLEDYLPADVKERQRLLGLREAIVNAHYPENYTMKYEAEKRLAFDELFLIQLGVLGKKRDWQESQPGNAFIIDKILINNFVEHLPFTLTSAQQKVIDEILYDLEQPRPMSRLLQGEVGSGKTVVAIIALLAACSNGFQGALMAPTEILAEQHYNGVCQLLASVSHKMSEEDNCRCYEGDFNGTIKLSLLTGKLSEKEKNAIQDKIREGSIDIVIGTHALIQKGVEFNNLGLAVIDEQHRFGVLQRSALRQKGFNPHILVMTATPIPRTLALTIYGDLDISVIDELPPGRQQITTRWIETEHRDRAYEFIRRQSAEGHQAFIICPLIEESEAIEAKAAVVEYERLSQDIFPDLKLGLLHGRMSQPDKEEIMDAFRGGLLNILVSTPVVEVGIDVPNATVMLVEAADRFGLSQLHQFRGRVGRGDAQSYCLLVAENPSAVGRERLRSIEKIYDGFALAEKDLEMRGPGEFFGTKQSGLPELRMAKLSDTRLLEIARNEAIHVFNNDPKLELAGHRPLADELKKVWQINGEWS
jgi:ATP-dependent DNA helicase RecG